MSCCHNRATKIRLILESLDNYLDLPETLSGLWEGRKPLPIGTTRSWKGGDYIKTAGGWRKVAAGRKTSTPSASTPEKKPESPTKPVTTSPKEVAKSTSAGNVDFESGLKKFMSKTASDYKKDLDIDSVKKMMKTYNEEVAMRELRRQIENKYVKSPEYEKIMKDYLRDLEKTVKDLSKENPNIEKLSIVSYIEDVDYSGKYPLDDALRRVEAVEQMLKKLASDKASQKDLGVSSETAASLQKKAKASLSSIYTSLKQTRKHSKQAATKVMSNLFQDLGWV